MKVVIVCLALVCVSGCALFVPPSIKREAALVRVDIETSGKEIRSLRVLAKEARDRAEESAKSGDTENALIEFRTASELDEQTVNKVMRSYKRVLPHVVNIDYYMKRRSAEGKK